MWCHVPGTDFPCAAEPVALIWASFSQSQTSTPVATSNGKNIQEAGSSQQCAPDTSPRPPFGMMSPPLTQSPSPERSTPCWLAIHVSHLARQDSARAKTTSATSGPTSSGSSENLAPHSSGASSRTSADILALASKPCCEPYDVWASRLRLAFSQRAKQVRRMSGSASSSWPTATVTTGVQHINAPTPGQTGGTSLAGAADAWPTPQARDLRSGDNPDSPRQKRKADQGWSQNLNDIAEGMWTTPQAHDVTMRGSGQKPTAKAGNRCLARDATTWPTPAARDHKGENSPEHLKNGTGRLHMDQLPNAVAHGFSHPGPMTVQHGPTSLQIRQSSRRLFRLATSNVPATTMRRWLRAGNWRKRRLNVAFVEHLMNWPRGHAVSNCSETEWCQYRQHMRGALLAMPMAYGPWIWEPPQKELAKPQQMDMFGEVVE
jgi:hypothetical protein